jgi:hypothetical protein
MEGWTCTAKLVNTFQPFSGSSFLVCPSQPLKPTWHHLASTCGKAEEQGLAPRCQVSLSSSTSTGLELAKDDESHKGLTLMCPYCHYI